MTGTPGDSAAGLAILQNRLQVADEGDREYLLKRHLRPTPRILQGQALRDLASSAIDLSDGLISDLGHIVKASACGARVDLDALPWSGAMTRGIYWRPGLVAASVRLFQVRWDRWRRFPSGI